MKKFCTVFNSFILISIFLLMFFSSHGKDDLIPMMIIFFYMALFSYILLLIFSKNQVKSIKLILSGFQRFPVLNVVTTGLYFFCMGIFCVVIYYWKTFFT